MEIKSEIELNINYESILNLSSLSEEQKDLTSVLYFFFFVHAYIVYMLFFFSIFFPYIYDLGTETVRETDVKIDRVDEELDIGQWKKMNRWKTIFLGISLFL
ncbi:hypothetical protein AAZX31_16G168000 [Glycine max]